MKKSKLKQVVKILDTTVPGIEPFSPNSASIPQVTSWIKKAPMECVCLVAHLFETREEALCFTPTEEQECALTLKHTHSLSHKYTHSRYVSLSLTHTQAHSSGVSGRMCLITI